MIPLARRLTRYHHGFLYAVLLLGFVAVITGTTTPLWLLIGFPLGMIGAHYFQRANLADPDQNRWWNALIIFVAIALFVEYLTNPLIDIMVFGIRFVLILTLIKLFSRQGPRDELQIYALSFLTIAAASTLNEDFQFGIYFGLYVLTGTFSLALFHLKTESSRQIGADLTRTSPFDRFYMSVLAGISLLIFAGSLLIFFAFPRIGLGLFADPSRSTVPITGFSDSVEVGDHGSVRDNPSVVMRVEFEDGPPADYGSLRWRTMTFDTYDGRGWSRQLDSGSDSSIRSHSQSYNLDHLYSDALREYFDDDDVIIADVYLEPLGSSVLPTLWPTSHLRMGPADTSSLLGTMPSLVTDDYADLHHTVPNDVGLTYQLTVEPRPSDEALRRSSGHILDPDDAAPYLQRPETDPRLEALAEDLTADADSNFEKAEAIGAHFFTEFQYTLDLPEITTDDPVAEFLFDHREGHCEYFATAAAMMLRSLDVPTRLVNGFLGGTWNDVGDYMTVRQGDAHAWIEIYVPDLGWVPYDPTPPIESTFLERAGITQMLADTVDTMRHTWTIWFLEYDLQSQIWLVGELGDMLSGEAGSSGESDTSESDGERDGFSIRPVLFIGGWLLLLLATLWRGRKHPRVESWRYGAGVLVATAGGAGWVGLFQAWSPGWIIAGGLSIFAAGAIPALLRHRRTPSDLRMATRLFRSIERAAIRAELARRPDEGPAGFLDRLAAERPAAAPHIEVFRTLYLDVRFGGRALGIQTRQKIRRAAREVCRKL